MNNLYRLSRYLRPYGSRMIAAVAATCGVGIATLGIVSLLPPILDRLNGDVEGLPGGGALQTSVTTAELLRLAGGLVVLYMLLGIARFLSTYLMGSVGFSMVRDLRCDLFRHLELLPLGFHTRHSTGGLMSRVTVDVLAVQEVLSRVLVDVLRDGLTVIGLVGYMFWLDWRLALAVLVGAPALVSVITRLGGRLRGASLDTQRGLGDASALLLETLTGIRIVKAFGMEEFEAEKFRRAAERLYRNSTRALRLASISSPLMELIAAVGGSAVLFYGAFQIQSGVLTSGQLVTFLLAAFMTYSPIRRLGAANARVQAAASASDRIFEILDAPVEVGYAAAEYEGVSSAAAPADSGYGNGASGRPSGSMPMPAILEGFRFVEVRFAYCDAEGELRDVLHGVSFEIPAGRAVALVGSSGAGKSTIANLIPRFYDPSGGAVEIDGTDLRDLPIADLRSQIGIVTQETILFNDTVRNNIAYGRPSVPMEAVEQAARAALADSFIEELPQGYETVLGERGLTLSGGQRQRIAIARALLKNAPILILDEATSNLDERSERQVQEALANLMEGRTTLIIAHRLTTVRRADLIIVLDRGRILESGTHHELVARPGPYKDLYSLQFADVAGPARGS
ncbi:MAG: ABC transporter ATP-binding protein [Acidobacteria bacterium]|nr:ABC transporter ATP-binding protein [Acidobacteriota bacterium]